MARKGLKAIVFGLLTGATIGVLFSPDKGSKIRSKINKKARSNKQVSSLLDSLTDKANYLFKRIKSELKLETKEKSTKSKK